MKIHRLGGEYVRIRSAKGSVVYTNVAIANSENYCRHDATSRIRRDINSVPLGKRGVSTSRDWGLRPATKSTCELISVNQVDRHAVEKAAEEFGTQIREWRPGGFSNIVEAVEIQSAHWSDRHIGAFIKRTKELFTASRCKSYPYKSLSSYESNSYTPLGVKSAISHQKPLHPLTT